MGGHAGRSKKYYLPRYLGKRRLRPTVGWTVLQGRDFSRAYGTDSTSAIVNEEGARILGFKDPGPIGKTVIHSGKPYTIIGVTKNMLVNNPYDKIQPAIFLGEGAITPYHPHQTRHARPHRPATIESVYKKFNPASPFLLSFNDEGYERKSSPRPRSAPCHRLFRSGDPHLLPRPLRSGLLRSGTTHKKRSARKVLGARVVNLWALLSGDFLSW